MEECILETLRGDVTLCRKRLDATSSALRETEDRAAAACERVAELSDALERAHAVVDELRAALDAAGAHHAS